MSLVFLRPLGLRLGGFHRSAAQKCAIAPAAWISGLPVWAFGTPHFFVLCQTSQSRFRSTAPLSRGALGKEGQLLRACLKKQKPPTPCQKHSIEGGLFSKSRFHSGLSLKADNGGHPHCDTQLPAACCPGALHAAVCKQASSQRPVLSAQTMQRYSARINAFILLPLYYSGAVQGSQGRTNQ